VSDWLQCPLPPSTRPPLVLCSARGADGHHGPDHQQHVCPHPAGAHRGAQRRGHLGGLLHPSGCDTLLGLLWVARYARHNDNRCVRLFERRCWAVMLPVVQCYNRPLPTSLTLAALSVHCTAGAERHLPQHELRAPAGVCAAGQACVPQATRCANPWDACRNHSRRHSARINRDGSRLCRYSCSKQFVDTVLMLSMALPGCRQPALPIVGLCAGPGAPPGLVLTGRVARRKLPFHLHAAILPICCLAGQPPYQQSQRPVYILLFLPRACRSSRSCRSRQWSPLCGAPSFTG